MWMQADGIRRGSTRSVKALLTKDASVPIAHQEAQGVERAEDILLQLTAEGVIESLDEGVRMTTPSCAEGTLFVSSDAFTPDEAEANEICVSDALTS